MLHDPICILERVVAPNSDDAKTLGFEPSRALSIMRCYDRMLAAIDLDDQLPFEADEIYDVSPNRSLPPELQSQGEGRTRDGALRLSAASGACERLARSYQRA